MSQFAGTASRALLVGGLLLLSGTLSPARAQSAADAGRPDFAPNSSVGWISSGTEFIALPTGPHPVTFDKAHPYVPNNVGRQPTLRVADVNNPILQPWVADALRKVNER